MLTDVQANIVALGESCDSEGNSGEMGRLLLRLISAFAQNFRNIVDGHEMASGATVGSSDGAYGSGYSDSSELYGGARIAYIFNESFVNRAIKHMNPFEGLEDVDIRTAIANANGARGPSLFIPEAAFELLVRKQIERLREPGLQCIDYVFEELQRMAYYADSPEISRFPHLRDKIYEVVNRLLRQCVTPTQQMINNLINIELCYINTSHPDFIGGKSAVAQMNKKMTKDAQGQQNQAQGPPSVGNTVRSATSPPAPTGSGNPNGLPPQVPVVQAAPGPAVAPPSSQGAGNSAAVGGIPGGGFFELFKSAPAVGSGAAPNAAVKAAPAANNGNSQYSSGGAVKLPPVSLLYLCFPLLCINCISHFLCVRLFRVTVLYVGARAHAQLSDTV